MIDPRLHRHPLGFLEVVDPPSPEELAEYYASTYYQVERGNYRHSYSPQELAVKMLRIVQRTEQALSLVNGKGEQRLLDVGCGEGFVLAAFSKIGWHVSGIDFSIAGVEAMNPEMTQFVQQGDVFTLLHVRISQGEMYDLVWLGNVLEHVLDPVGLLQSLRAIVSNDGLLVVTVPNDGTTYHEGLFADGLINRRWWIAIPDHISYFTSDSLEAIAEATGWECASMMGDFPIDIFLSHPGSNYVDDPARGHDAHQARLRLETLISAAGHDKANRFYEALAQVGLGRNLTAFLRPKSQNSQPAHIDP